MNLSTEIKFSNNLIKNKSTYISYSGNLYKQNSNSVYMVYGYGDNWAHTTEQRMTKNSKGFVAKVNVPQDFDNLNFCFRNQNNEWDNNSGSNYNAPISEETDDYEENFIINDGIIINIADNLFKYNIGNLPNTSNKPTSSINTVAQELFSDIYNKEEKIENFQDESSNTDEENLEIIDNNPVDIENIEITDDEPITVEINPEVSTFIESVINEEINDEINDNTSESIEEIKSEETKENSFNMDSLIEEILTPITNSQNFEKENLDSLKKENSFSLDINEMLNIQDDEKNIERDKKIDNIINNYFDDIYENIDKKVVTNNSQKAINKLEQIEQLNLNTEPIEEPVDNTNEVEESLIENAINSQDKVEDNNSEKALIVSPRHATPFYMTRKRIKVAFLKIINFLPRLLSGKFNEEK